MKSLVGKKLFVVKGRGLLPDGPVFEVEQNLVIVASNHREALGKVPRALKRLKITSWKTESVSFDGTIDA